MLYQNIKGAVGEEKVGRTQGFEWFSKFSIDMISVDDDEHSEHLSMSKAYENVDQVTESVFKPKESLSIKLPKC
jgi:hypothetical protein